MAAISYPPRDRYIAIHVDEVLQNLNTLYDLIRDRVFNLNSIDQCILFFIEYYFNVDTTVTLIYRVHDISTVGHIRNGIGYLLNQQRGDELRRTKECLRAYSISFKVLDNLGDSYSDMEMIAKIQRSRLKIGQKGFIAALSHLLVPNPESQLDCEGSRNPHIRHHIITHFQGFGAVLPVSLLELLYGWGPASHNIHSHFVGAPDRNPVIVGGDTDPTQSRL